METKIIPIKGTDNVILRTQGFDDIAVQSPFAEGNIRIKQIIAARKKLLRKTQGF